MPTKPGTTRNLLLACFLIVAAIVTGLTAFLVTTSRKDGESAASSLRASSSATEVPVATTAMPVTTAATTMPTPSPSSDTRNVNATTMGPGFDAQSANYRVPTSSPTATPVVVAPTASPVVAPTTETPTTSVPTVVAPSSSAPITAAPSSSAQTTAAPITSSPITSSPVVQLPTSLPPSTASPVVVTSTDIPTTFPPTALATAAVPFAAPTLPPQIFPPFDEDTTTFRLKMYWQEGYFWQEETRPRFWCVECTKCDTLNFGDDGEGCDFAWDCEAGHQLWLHGCRNGYGHVFKARTVGAYHQIVIHGKNENLCLERTQRRYMTVQACDRNNEAQWWHKIRADGGPFELRPANGSRDPEPFCVTQQHHPKPGEILGLKECRQAHRWETGYWNTFQLYPGHDMGPTPREEEEEDDVTV